MERLDELASDGKELTKAVVAPDTHINKRFDELQAQIDKHAEILANK